jgi:hypothetical protein
VKRVAALCGTVCLAIVFVVVMIVGWSVGRGAGYAQGQTAVGKVAVAGAPSTPPHLYLVIHRGEQLNNEPLGPAYMPSVFTLPGNTTVTVTITNFDDATTLPDNAAKFAKASGIDRNTFLLAPMDPRNPNAIVAATPTSQLSSTTIAHTFTIQQINLNVPIAAESTTTFTFHTPTGCDCMWRCMDPCGIGPVGWGGAMSTEGYMMGKATFL